MMNPDDIIQAYIERLRGRIIELEDENKKLRFVKSKEFRRLETKYNDLVKHANKVGLTCIPIEDCGWCSTGH
jgi:poly-D-alanine transfer protein DltD